MANERIPSKFGKNGAYPPTLVVLTHYIAGAAPNGTKRPQFVIRNPMSVA